METQTPILDALVKHVGLSRLPLHVPGHKQGKLLPQSLSAWLGAGAKLDLTELPGLDNFHQPEGCIAASQALASQHYGSDRCLYSVNGSTACVMAALMGTLSPLQSVLCAGPIHQSAWRGLILANAFPVFAPSTFDPSTGTFAPITYKDVEMALERHPGVRAVYITSPTYTGEVAPVRDIARLVHSRNIPLIVDEAHGPHFGLLPELPNHSVAEGADVVIHSVHKMLPGLTQVSWMHLTGNLVQPDRIESALRLLHTTSPSYLLLASLDSVQAWLRTSARETALGGYKALKALYNSTTESVGHRDPFRHLIPTGDAEVSQDLAEQFAKRGMYVEYADPVGVLSIFSLAATELEVERYLSVARGFMAGSNRTSPALDALIYLSRTLWNPRFSLSPREAYDAPKRQIPLSESRGAVCGELVTPYPPGVPVVWPGQIIDEPIQDALQALVDARVDVHGISPNAYITVTTQH